MTDVQITVAEALTLRPGDRVLLRFASHIPPRDVQHISQGLHERFPGVEFTWLCGVDEIAVQPAGEEAT